jgi:hypothetical protein
MVVSKLFLTPGFYQNGLAAHNRLNALELLPLSDAGAGQVDEAIVDSAAVANGRDLRDAGWSGGVELLPSHNVLLARLEQRHSVVVQLAVLLLDHVDGLADLVS